MERLQKVLAKAGVASRRGADRLIAEGRVKVDGKPAVVGMKVDPETQKIMVNGKPIGQAETTVVYLFHKPVDVVTTLSDPQGRRSLSHFLDKVKERVFPVGRLDRDASGLLLLTNDGRLAQALMHPRHHVDKTYLVGVRGRADTKALKKLAAGVMIGERLTAPARVNLVERQGREAMIALTIHEGRYHQVKRMCKQVGLVVNELKRISVGPLELGSLPPGRMRPLKPGEVKKLRLALEQESTRKKPRDGGRSRPPRQGG